MAMLIFKVVFIFHPTFPLLILVGDSLPASRS